MGKIRDDIVESILSRARIEEVVGDFVQLKRKGARYVGLCPFHDDRHVGNFSVYPKKNVFKCFACDVKGDSVAFIRMKENLSFSDAIRWLGKKYNIETDMEDFNYTPPTPVPAPPPLPTLVLPSKYVNSRRDLTDDNFVKFLRALPWDGAARQRIDGVLEAYRVGHSKYGHTIWWQIDEDYQVRTGKMMLYKTDGHRDKQSPHNFDWIHKSLERKGMVDLDTYEMRQCYFGQHLLKVFPKAEINVVESEKTAVIMSIAYGCPEHQIWVACGGLTFITQERLEPFIKTGRYITLFPDRDGRPQWKDKLDTIDYKKLRYNDEFVTKYWVPEDGEKADIADIIVRWVMQGKRRTAIETYEEMKEKSLALRLLDEKLGTKPVEQ
jgi:hypothetical protein